MKFKIDISNNINKCIKCKSKDYIILKYDKSKFNIICENCLVNLYADTLNELILKWNKINNIIYLYKCPYCNSNNIKMRENLIYTPKYQVKCYDCGMSFPIKKSNEDASKAFIELYNKIKNGV